jgi:guanylate kinase
MQKALGNLKKGLAFVLSAPAGTGKTTLAKMLFAEFACISSSVSFTTRKPRVGEIEGKDYHFITVEQFEEKIAAGEFLEYAKVYQDYYGTSKSFVAKEQSAGKHVLLVIDTQGALQLKKSIDATFIFIQPPCLNTLHARLSARKSETAQSIEHRLSWAEKELSMAPMYDYQIINEDLHTAYLVLKSIFIAEEHKNRALVSNLSL